MLLPVGEHVLTYSFDIGLDRGGVTTLLICGALVAAGLMLVYRVRTIVVTALKWT